MAHSNRVALRAHGLGHRALGYAQALGLLACSVDGRGLVTSVEAATGAGGDRDYGADSVAGAGGASECGRSGSCWSFEADVEGWQAEEGVSQRWTSADVTHEGASGSLVVTNFDTQPGKDFWTAGTWQCMPVRESTDYGMSLAIFIPSNQEAGAAGFGLEYFNAPECAGLLLDLSSFLTATTGAWLSVQRSGPTPEGAKSALLRLLVTKVHEGPSFEARFDDVSLGAR
jgi:hypothetical protein